MNNLLSANTQAILLLTAPLIAGKHVPAADLLTVGEYKKLARFLREKQIQPADLLSRDSDKLIDGALQFVDSVRLRRLLERGFLLSQAVERWQARAIWVVSRADEAYPKRLKARMKEDAPSIIYGCGDVAILSTGGLAVVGSRNVDDTLVSYTENVGQLTARARQTLISGAARGIDQAAMRGALEAGGKVVGIMADSLERAVMIRENRSLLMDGQLVLISPYDPSAGFNVGHAMQRNKLIYALSDAALVVSSDYQKGGTWAGAVEQLHKLLFVPVYVRATGEPQQGLNALLRKGALCWPDPGTPESLVETINGKESYEKYFPKQDELLLAVHEESGDVYQTPQIPVHDESHLQDRMAVPSSIPSQELFSKVRELLGCMTTPKTDIEVAQDLQVTNSQAKEWLKRLVKEGALKKLSKPARYCSAC
ncbi:MAG: DNA-processing protein DprA [Syntrophus sp. (in: bacteria)]